MLLRALGQAQELQEQRLKPQGRRQHNLVLRQVVDRSKLVEPVAQLQHAEQQVPRRDQLTAQEQR